MDDNSTDNRNISIPLTIISVSHIGVTLVANTVLHLILRRQEILDEVSRLLHQTFSLLSILLSITWYSWNIVWYGTNSVLACTTVNKILPFPTYTFLCCSMLTLCFISICKYILITRPLRHHLILKLRTVKGVVFGSFIIMTLICSPLLPWPNSPIFEYFTSECNDWSRSLYLNNSWVAYYIHYFFATPVVISGTVTTITNFAILRVVFRQSRQLDVRRPGNDNVRNLQRLSPPRNQRRLPGKGIITTLAVTFSFYICWYPLVLVKFMVHVTVTWEYVAESIPGFGLWSHVFLYVLTNREAKDIVKEFFMKRR